MKDKTIVLRTFDTLPQAQFACDILKQNGVECFMDNVYMSQLYPVFNPSVSGIRVIILEADKARAEQILAEGMG